jgi:hypothetical protein
MVKAILLNDNIITAAELVFLLQYTSFKLRVIVEKKLFFASISQAIYSLVIYY